MIKVVKFGGSSLASAHQFKKVKAIIRAEEARRFVVPSAPGKRSSGDIKVTDLLYAYYDAITAGQDGSSLRREIHARFDEIIHGLGLSLDLTPEFARIAETFRRGCGRDYAASRGEYLNSLIIAKYLGFEFLDAAQVICFDEEGNFLPEKTNRRLSARLAGKSGVVIPGFYGSLPDGTIKTFSRGGSDITGSLVARAVRADLYENWTDVSGFLLADPRIVENPVPIGTITYGELHELAAMGACVLHEDAIFPVKQEGIPINIKNTNRPQDPGTMIVSSTSQRPSYKITGIAGKKGYCAVHIRKTAINTGIGLDETILQMLEEKHIPCETLPSGLDTLSLLVWEKALRGREQSILSGIRQSVHPDSISVEPDMALVAVGGRGAKHQPGIAGRVFSALETARISVMAADEGSRVPTMLVGVRSEDFEPAVRAIYNKFIRPEPVAV